MGGFSVILVFGTTRKRERYCAFEEFISLEYLPEKTLFFVNFPAFHLHKGIERNCVAFDSEKLVMIILMTKSCDVELRPILLPYLVHPLFCYQQKTANHPCEGKV